MRATYADAIDRIIRKYEGAYGWDKGDRGGPTKYGITCFDLAEHRGTKMDSMVKWAPIVEAMELGEAEDIYRSKYASGLHYDDLRAGVDACMLDYGINSGVSRPVHSACAILGLASSGVLTSAIVGAINKADPAWFINAMCQERLAFMHGIRGGSDWERFGHGWQARVDDVEKYSKALAQGASSGAAPVPMPVPKTPKATHTDPHLGKKAVAIGTTTSPTATATAHAAGAPQWVSVGIFVVVVLGVCAWYLWTQAKNAKANTMVVLPVTIPPQPVPHVQV